MTSETLSHIGSREFVSFPNENINHVAAKVDTGADYSSVWASDITEHEGTLRFRLFGKGSKYYTGEEITTEEYGITEVKNSFGHSEQRYTVKLTVQLGGKKIRAGFRLADRSNNRFPILIGKKTIAKRFIVDVSIDNTKDVRKQRVLVLNSKPSNSVKHFVEAVNDISEHVECDFMQYDDLTLVLGSEHGIEILRADTHQPIERYDLIYFKTYFAKAEVAAALAEYAQMSGINFIDSEVASYRSITKVSQYARLARFGIAIPTTIVMSPLRIAEEFGWLKEKLGLPFILKDAAADKGQANYLIQSEEDFQKAAAEAKEREAYYTAQDFVPNDGDYRIIVLDKEIDFVIKRQKADDTTHLNNTSTGGTADIIEAASLPSTVLKMSIEAGLVLKREVAGVDVIQNKDTGEWLVLEVNNSPQLASGAYPEEKIKVFEAFLKRQSAK